MPALTFDVVTDRSDGFAIMAAVAIFKRRSRRADHDLTPDARALVDHLHRLFPDRRIVVEAAAQRRIYARVPTFHLLVVRPDQPGEDSPVHRQAQTMTAWYHAGPPSQRLDHGHTLPIGEPWLPGSQCDHLLVSLPYPWGPQFEVCHWADGHIRLLWLLPITRSERDYKITHGLEALERRLEQADINPLDPHRPAVV